jgi:hypothetical protein
VARGKEVGIVDEIVYCIADGEWIPSTHENALDDPFATFEEWGTVDDELAYREL